MKKKLLLFMLFVSLVCFISGCSKNIEGEYTLTYMVKDNKEIDLKSLENNGYKVTLSLKDNKGTFELFGNKQDVEYNDKTITIDKKETPYKIDNDKLIIESGSDKMEFSKNK